MICDFITTKWRSIPYLMLVILVTQCSPPAGETNYNITEQEVATKWADLTLFVTKNTPANSPTYASRCLGYIGLTMYESIVHGFPPNQSLVGQLNDMPILPLPEEDAGYSWIISLNAAEASILKSLYNQTSDENKMKVDSLEENLYKYFAGQIETKEVVDRSVAFGKSIAEAIFEWSKTDGGHRAYLKNFDRAMKHPNFPGSWKPPLYSQSISHFPLHPYWGENRTFLKSNADLPIPEMIPYDTTAGSPYYQQFLHVYEMDKALTQKEKETAIWWGDDPSETFTPPGHSYYLANMAVKQKNPPLIKCAETFARVGMAVADAFINCWKWKYHHFAERPNTFIPAFIDPEWVSFWPDPPFPSFPSGHAIQAASSTTVLADLYGDEIHLVDSAHFGRKRDDLRDVDFTVRAFDSFWSVASETANSRFYGGIHTPQDNDVGLEQGKIIAGNVNQLHWRYTN